MKGYLLAAAAFLAWASAAGGAGPAPRLYVGSEGWGAVAGEDGRSLWVGRIPAGAERVEAGGESLSVAEGLPLPMGAAALPGKNNPFGDCIVRSLSVRFDQAVKGRSWSLIGSSSGKAGEFARLKDAKGGDLKLVFTLEDAQSGARWRLVPERMAQEGGVYSWFRGSARAYAGTLDGGKIDWLIATEKMSDGKWIVQGRVMLMEKETRFFRLCAGVADAADAIPIAGWEGGSEHAPGVVVRRDNGSAVALLADLSEPRRMRAVCDAAEEGMALEFDLAATPSTANFPRRAAFSVTLETWKTEDAASLEQDAAERWTRPVSDGEAITESEAAGLRAGVWCPGREMWGRGEVDRFLDGKDAWGCLEVLASGLAPEGQTPGAARTTARSCAARDAEGNPLVLVDEEGLARGVVNVDPDLRMPFAMGMNRGLWAREVCLTGSEPGGWVCVEVAEGGLDYQARALEMCDYPTVWSADTWRPAVETIHAQSEWLLAMGCAVREAGGRLCVWDDGPYAPFTTYAADALLSGSVDEAVLRRTRLLAGGRPCVWSATLARRRGPGEEAVANAERLARELGFVVEGE